MKIVDVIKYLISKNLNCGENLTTFFNYYQKLLNQLYLLLSTGISDREKYMINRLIDWSESEGNLLFYKTVTQLNEDSCDKIEGFVELYTFLLEKSEDDVMKLIDQLFFIPGQFEKEFHVEQKVYEHVCIPQNIAETVMYYIFNTQGAILKAPYLI